jgi:hypothetical protein
MTLLGSGRAMTRRHTFEHFAICSGLRLPLTLEDGDGS